MNEKQKKLVAETKESLQRIQNFDATTIARTDELGRELNFAQGVEPLERSLALFREVSVDVLESMSASSLNQVKGQSDALFNLLQQMLNFSAAAEGNPKATRDSLIQQLANSYEGTFNDLCPTIAYSVRRATDFSRMEREARAAIQSIEDRSRELESSMKAKQEEAEAALAAIRKVAAEQGVSQQAIYFREESQTHADEAEKWLKWTKWLTVVLGLFAGSTLVLHKVPLLRPENSAEVIQFALGKMLVFATGAYFLILAARNYMAHRHNAIVNRHRQNSLITYQALVEAAGDQANRDIVLTKAAESIFGAQTTGFTKHDADEGKAFSMVNLGTSALKGTGSG
ncbi:MAG: hypothetical protein SFV15_20365 [Polyangiaceae bacterium]|nr:hypothetical protein [Polyangiaceae bacterium]